MRKNHNLVPENAKNVSSPVKYRLKVYVSKRNGMRAMETIVEVKRIKR
jgi:hypothetical protein